MQATIKVGIKYGMEVWIARIVRNGETIASHRCLSEAGAKTWIVRKLATLGTSTV
jgi:hypothetical protein